MAALLNPRTVFHRRLCALLALLIAAGPAVPTLAQPPRAEVAGSPLKYVAPDACAVVVLRPKQVFDAESMRMLPLEVIQAAGIKEAGVDPLRIEQIVVSAAPPREGPPAFAVHAVFASASELKRGRLTGHTVPGELNGRKYLKSQHALLPSFLAPDSTSLLAAPERVLTQLMVNAPSDSPLATQVGAAAAGDDLYAWIDVEALRPLLRIALSKLPPGFPEQAQPLLEIPNLLKSIELTINVSQPTPSELVVTASSEADAQRIEAILEQMKDVVRVAMISKMDEDPQTQRMLASKDPVEQAMGRYTQRLQAEMMKSLRDFRLTRDGTTFHLIQIDPAQAGQQQFTQAAVIGVLVALLLPAVQAAREAARRTAAMNNMKQILLGLLMHENEKKSFPAHAIYSDDGRPLLSWRVQILPYLGEQALYDKFHLDEPWDSEHNTTLIPLMPQVYLDPSSPLGTMQGARTTWESKEKGCSLTDRPIRATSASSATVRPTPLWCCRSMTVGRQFGPSRMTGSRTSTT